MLMQKYANQFINGLGIDGRVKRGGIFRSTVQ